MTLLAAYEHRLAANLYASLQSVPGIRVYAPAVRDVPPCADHLVTVAGMRPERGLHAPGGEGHLVWDGHFYAVRPMEVLGLLDKGGVTRVGISMYTTEDETGRLLNEVRMLQKRELGRQ